MQTGVWKYSRHPNYAGELLLWFGLAIVSSGAIRAPFSMVTMKTLPFLSPLFEGMLIIGVSGVPMSERAQRSKYGNTEEYQRYVQETPVLLPFTKKLEQMLVG